MIRALIVEDETTIRSGLVRHLKWAELGVDEVRAAESAEEAFSILENYRPDLVLTDIRMPGMDGIQMATAIRERFPDTQIAFITGYTDKEYLQAAISIGVVGYVEKPVSLEELTEIVRKAVHYIQKIRHIQMATLHSLINYSQALGEREEKDGWNHYVLFTIRTKKHPIEHFSDMVAELTGKLGREYGFDLAEVMSDHVTSLYYAILVCRMTPWQKEQAGRICEDILAYVGEDRSWFVTSSGEYGGRENIPEAYRESIETQKHLSYKGWNSYACPDELCVENRESISEEQLHAFYKLLMEGKREAADRFAEEQTRSLICEHAVMNLETRNRFYEMDRAVTKVCRRNGRTQEYDGGTQMEFCMAFEDLLSYVKHHIAFALEKDSSCCINYQIREVCDYIREHLGDKDLSLTRLAEVVYLTPAYLSSMFSKNMNGTVGQYITDCRMEKAKELLKNPQYRLYEVAEIVGYEDAKYFSKAFKKNTGTTPKEYRYSL